MKKKVVSVPKVIDFYIPTGSQIIVETSYTVSVIKEICPVRGSMVIDLVDYHELPRFLRSNYGEGGVNAYKLAKASIQILEGDNDGELDPEAETEVYS